MYVLDTNTLIYFFKGMGGVSEVLLNKSPQDVKIPAVVIFELEVGIAKSNSPEKRIKQLEELTSVIETIPFGSREAKISASIRADLEKMGTPIGPYDLLIAGTAVAHGASLITRNTKEFERIKTLQIENWF